MLPDAWREPLLYHAHNAVLDFWSMMGVIGLAAFLWLEIAFWRMALRLRRAPSRPTARPADRARGEHGLHAGARAGRYALLPARSRARVHVGVGDGRRDRTRKSRIALRLHWRASNVMMSKQPSERHACIRFACQEN